LVQIRKIVPFCSIFEDNELTSKYPTLFKKLYNFCWYFNPTNCGKKVFTSENPSEIIHKGIVKDLKPNTGCSYIIHTMGLCPMFTATAVHPNSTASLFVNSFASKLSNDNDENLAKEDTTYTYMGTTNLTLNQSIARPLPKHHVVDREISVRLYVTLINIQNASEAHLNAAGNTYYIEIKNSATLISGFTLGMIGLVYIIFS
jgi:hypothetical protein